MSARRGKGVDQHAREDDEPPALRYQGRPANEERAAAHDTETTLEDDLAEPDHREEERRADDRSRNLIARATRLETEERQAPGDDSTEQRQGAQNLSDDDRHRKLSPEPLRAHEVERRGPLDNGKKRTQHKRILKVPR